MTYLLAKLPVLPPDHLVFERWWLALEATLAEAREVARKLPPDVAARLPFLADPLATTPLRPPRGFVAHLNLASSQFLHLGVESSFAFRAAAQFRARKTPACGQRRPLPVRRMRHASCAMCCAPHAPCAAHTAFPRSR